MTFFELVAISVGLAMDAFAVSICKGLSISNLNMKKACRIASFFGIFQAIMPIIGFYISSILESKLNRFSHLIAFLILLYIGLHMIKESKDNHNELNEMIDFKTMIMLAIATSIDALAVGVTFSVLHVSIITASIVIGTITFIITLAGAKIGSFFGKEFGGKAQILGGIILIIIGIKILTCFF